MPSEYSVQYTFAQLNFCQFVIFLYDYFSLLFFVIIVASTSFAFLPSTFCYMLDVLCLSDFILTVICQFYFSLLDGLKWHHLIEQQQYSAEISQQDGSNNKKTFQLVWSVFAVDCGNLLVCYAKPTLTFSYLFDLNEWQ